MAYKKFRNNKNLNVLRQIIRDAANRTKNIEWQKDIKVSKAAIWQWDELEKIFDKLGGFIE